MSKDFEEQKKAVEAELDELLSVHREDVERLEGEVKEAKEDTERAEEELDARENDPGHALDVLFQSPDGRRLIERAFLADPKKTSMELNYLGAYEIRGELEVQAALVRGAFPVEPQAAAALRRTPRA